MPSSPCLSLAVYLSSDFCASPLRPQHVFISQAIVGLELSDFERLRRPKHPRAGLRTSSRPRCTLSHSLNTPRRTREGGRNRNGENGAASMGVLPRVTITAISLPVEGARLNRHIVAGGEEGVCEQRRGNDDWQAPPTSSAASRTRFPGLRLPPQR